MTTVFTGRVLSGFRPLYFLKDVLGEKHDEKEHLWNVFRGASGNVPIDFLKVIEDPAQADFFLLPYNYFSLKESQNEEARNLITRLSELAERYKKKLIIFCMDDSDECVDIPNAVILRYSQYGYKKKENEIITPPYPLHSRSSELAGYRRESWRVVSFRDKPRKPVVSFCGWAGFPSWYRWATYQVRILIADFKRIILRDAHAELHKNGIYFRRKALRALKYAKNIKTNFIIRDSFSAQKKSSDAEKEYIENILNSDFVLAPKGHGNASVRFYEALSLGRFPVLIDTDCELPLKEHIDYEKFVVTVDHTRVASVEDAILAFFNSLSGEEYKRRQQMARGAFELLRPGSFLKIVLSELKERQWGYRC